MRFYFEEGEKWAEHKRAVFQKINRAQLPLVLFGKTSVVDRAFLQQINVPVRFICDNNPEKWGSTLWGLEVTDPSRLAQIYPAYNVLILVPFEHQIVPQLHALPVPPTEIFKLDLYFEEENTAEYYRNMQSELEEIYDCLCDQKSKDTYEAVIRYHIFRDSEILRPISLPRETQYFPDTLGGTPLLHTEEVFADAGAFVGDTVESFSRAVDGRYRSIYAFEAEMENYKKLLANTQEYHDVQCAQVAVSDRAGEIRFISDDSGSKVDQRGQTVVPTDTLDHLLKNVPVTYLKMDVEGMECAALDGAKELIRTHHPKLAICTYHSDADMIKIPKRILELDSGYKLYFRHYTNWLVETVCYAI